jgi:hypothetical protein
VATVAHTPFKGHVLTLSDTYTVAMPQQKLEPLSVNVLVHCASDAAQNFHSG